MHKPRLALFGTPIYSLIVFEQLQKDGYPISVVITKPPLSLGRHKHLTPTPVSEWAQKNHIPLLTFTSDFHKPWLFADEARLTSQVLTYNPELIITADFTLKVPMSLLKSLKFQGLNVHPSLLPSYRGPAPIPWAVLNGEKNTGVSIVTLNNTFDSGRIIKQEEIPIQSSDTTPILMSKLFSLGAQLLSSSIASYQSSPSKSISPVYSDSYFGKLTRQHGKEPWQKIKSAISDGLESERIERKWRALHPWPGLWTEIKIGDTNKRMKILSCKLSHDGENKVLILEEIQLEGKTPISFKSIEKSILVC